MTEIPLVDILILGAGWTATFLIPLLRQHNISFAATTTAGREVSGYRTIKYRFAPNDQSDEAAEALRRLPRALHVLVTFPLPGADAGKDLIERYSHLHGYLGPGESSQAPRFVQLGSTGMWRHDPAQTPWLDRGSPYDKGKDDGRVAAEDQFLRMGGCVLNLAGLWGGARDPRLFLGRVASTKEALREKTSLHMIHGVDVARVIMALVARSNREQWDSVGKGQRWMVTDGFVYDYWSLFAGWADPSGEADDGKQRPIKQAAWVHELMQEEGVRALPRPMEALGRCYDSRELWSKLGITPLKGGLGL